MTKTRYAIFALAAMGLAVLATVGILLVGDVYLHRRYMDVVALNVWGYRGPAVGGKQPGEWRLAFLGESTAFGYGVHWRDAVPALLQEQLNADAGAGRRATVLNLAYNNEGAHSYRFTLDDYDYLDYDAVLIYSGYNDLAGNVHIFRHASLIFRLTGYLPIFPMIFQEKAMAIRWNGRLEDAYQGRRTTFVPNITERATATALETAARITKSLDEQFAHTPDAQHDVDRGERFLRVMDEGTTEGTACGIRFEHYCGEMYLAIKQALDADRQVLVVGQPYLTPLHREQQALVLGFLERRFAGHAGLHFASMADVVDLQDPALAYDGMHLTPAGNRRIAAALLPHARQLMP